MSSLEKLDQRLLQLPGFIAAGISPEAIVAEIDKKLQQAFIKSTIPATWLKMKNPEYSQLKGRHELFKKRASGESVSSTAAP